MAGVFKLSSSFTYLTFLLLLFDQQYRYLNHVDRNHLWTGAVEVYVGREVSTSPLPVNWPRRRTKAPAITYQKYPTTARKCLRLIHLTQQIIIVNVLLMYGDISLNPGPAVPCPSCLKTIRKNQSYAQCSTCQKRFHLKCFGADFDSNMECSQCTIQNLLPNEAEENHVEAFLPPKLTDIPKTRGFKILHQNIRSLLGKIDELRLIFSELHSGIHLLTFSETWAHKDITDSELDIPGYQLFRRDRGSKGGGLVVYSRNDLSVIRRTDLEKSNVEGLWPEVCLPKSRSFLVGTFYRPPTSSNHSVKDLMPVLEDTLQAATATGKEVIITGDLNCDLSAKRSLPTECKQLKSLLKAENLTQLIKQPTRITQDSSTLLDVIITNCPQIVSESGVLSMSLSDHDMVYCIRKLNWMKAPSQTKIFRNYANYDQAEFCQDLKDVDWDIVENPEGPADGDDRCVDDLWSSFKSKFDKVADRHAPLIHKRVCGLN